MSSCHDQAYLLQKQYQNASNFNARVELHARFSTNKYGFCGHLYSAAQLNAAWWAPQVAALAGYALRGHHTFLTEGTAMSRSRPPDESKGSISVTTCSVVVRPAPPVSQK